MPAPGLAHDDDDDYEMFIINLLTNRIHELESELAELKLDPSGISGVEKRLRREVERYQRELEDKEQELEETKHRLEEVASNEERLGEINSELNHQMALMVQEFDEDKKTALEKCQEACLQHHEVAKAKLREELMCQQNEDRTKLLEQHDSEIKQLKAELVQCQKELDEVKELYVNICEEKETLEEKLRQDWETKLEEEISKVRSECDQEKDEALDNQQKELTSKSQEKLNKEMWRQEQEEELKRRVQAQVRSECDQEKDEALDKQQKELTSKSQEKLNKEMWRQEQEEELKRRVQAQVAMAKVAWFDEQRESKEAAVASAVKQVEKQWQLKFEEKIENEVERKMYAAKSKLESDRRLSFENELLERLKLEKKKWEEQTEVQISSAVEKARLKWEQQHQPQDVDSLKAQWMQGQQELIEQEVAKALKEAKDNWEHAQRSEIETALMKAKLQAETELREAVDKVKVTHKQEVESLKLELENLEKESHSAKSSWLAEKQKLLTQKEAEQQRALHELEEQQAAQIKEMQEVQLGILQSNLRNAKEQYDREKTALQKQYEEQIDHLKKRVKSLQSEHAKADSDALQELQQQFCKEKEVLESTWQKRLEDANRSHGHQMETLKTKLQEETESILAEARKEWTLQYEQEMKKACQEVAENQKQLWENERSKLMQKIKDLEEQLQTTHANWESELETLRADMERTQFGKVPLDGSGSKSSPERKYEQQLASLQARLSAKEEELQQSEQFYSARLQNARADLQEECDKAIERLEQEKHRLAEQIDDLKSKLEKLDSRKRELQTVLQQSEEEHRQSVNSYKDKNNELNEKVRQLEEQLKSAKSQQENSLDNLRQHLEEKHMAAVEDFRWKLFESNRDNQAAIERINREHEREIRDLKQKVENQRKEVVCTPVQTDGGLVDAKLLDQLKAHYLETVTKIREDVLRHVNETNSRAAKRVKAEVAKERQATAARVKTFCIRGLEKLLSNMDSAKKSKIISAMKELLLQFSPNPTPSSTPKPNPRETPSRNSTEYHGDPVQPTKEHPSLSSQRTQTPGYRNNTAPDVPRLNPEQDQVRGKTSHYVVDLSVKGTVSPGPHGLTQEEPTTPSRESAFHQIGGAGGPHTQQDIFNSDQHGALEFLNRMENQYPSDHSTPAPAPARVDGRNSKADDRQTSTGNRRVITGNQRNSSRYNNYSSNGEMDIHIGESDGGLSKLPQQPRTYNPSPEKLDSEQDSRCSSPAENFITVRSGRGFQRASCLENGYSNGDNQKPKPSQLQPVRDIPEGRSAGSAMLKPIAMVTRHTQMPSPAPKKLSLKS
ncbi:trichohyalin-like [Lingula anatina]|uniref:Trichohyalin-like n=1 Tax=Lingula anatina TaxID=7574 RepID=A0A1S3JMG1_LINAN|nr:trichohyalin-like [Lingula anatina]|eukprot:XP_013411573.1 trichohyalin-like [Lingula anatina]